MIHNINELKRKPLSFIVRFIENCTIEEKIDAYYVCVEIQGKNSLVFRKSNGSIIDRVDCILNEMWSRLINDWTHIKLANQEWFENHIGSKIYMFYLPVQKPILTEYIPNVRYIVDRMISKGTEADPYNEMAYDMNMMNEFNVYWSDKLPKSEYDMDDIVRRIKAVTRKNNPDTSETFEDIFKSVIGKDAELFASNEPEGYIFKLGKGHIYQLINNPNEERKVSTEQTQYEYLLLAFMKFWRNNDLTSLIDRSYVKSVCHLFNAFINQEKLTHTIEDNVYVSGLENPCVGHRFDICYTNIPNEITVQLCKENELYKNIFKILLVNLRKKKSSKNTVLISENNVKEWNNIVKTIENTCI